MDIQSMLQFIRTLPMDEGARRTVASIKKSVEAIYAIEVKEFAREQKEYEKEKKDAVKKRRDKKRSEADRDGKKKGLLGQIFGTKSERKQAGNDLMKMLGIGALIAGGGVLAFNFKDEISEWVGEQASIIGAQVLDYAKELAKDMEGWVENELAWVFTAAANNQSYSQGTTASGGGEDGTQGLEFTWQDVKFFQEKHRDKLKLDPSLSQNQQYITRASTFNQLDAQMRATKSLNDQLYNKNNELTGLEGKNKTDAATRRQIEKLKKEIDDLKTNKASSQVKVTEMWTSLGIGAQELIDYQKMSGRRSNDGAWIQRQTGGTIDNDKTKQPPSGKEIDERMFSTTDYEDGSSIAKRPTKDQRLHLQTGGLVLFKGHGDVPPGSGIAPGTDGPGTDYQGKYKPTAEQYFVDKVATATERLAKKENVPISYQRPTGYYHKASHPKSNWSMANKIRRSGGSAIELHFDAYGTQNGKFIEGARGMLTGGNGPLSAIEKGVQSKFGTHPMSSQGWGTLMLELDSLRHARNNVDKYARMLVSGVKNAGAKGTAPATAKPGTSAPSTPAGAPSNNSSTTQTQPTAPQQTQSTNPFSSMMSGLQNLMSGFGAFSQGFSEGFSSTFKNPFAKAEKHQLGGTVGGKGSKLTKRFKEAQSTHNVGAGDNVIRPVVRVVRRPQTPSGASGPSKVMPIGGSTGGLNMVAVKQALHRQLVK